MIMHDRQSYEDLRGVVLFFSDKALIFYKKLTSACKKKDFNSKS